MKIKILSVGKKHDQLYLEAIEDYLKRLNHYANASFVLIPPCKNSSLLESEQKIDEGERILKTINKEERVVLLDETGRFLSSPDLALGAQDMVFIIGGAFGVSPDVFKRADLVFSLSKLVFPHMMVRLILVETLYRSMTILNNGKYHHF
jgi:23S rRNA (pseudouridine1915-N3)-methyltransferase